MIVEMLTPDLFVPRPPPSSHQHGMISMIIGPVQLWERPVWPIDGWEQVLVVMMAAT